MFPGDEHQDMKGKAFRRLVEVVAASKSDKWLAVKTSLAEADALTQKANHAAENASNAAAEAHYAASRATEAIADARHKLEELQILDVTAKSCSAFHEQPCEKKRKRDN